MLTPHCSAASGMVAPPSIASTTRLRKSSEYGFAIHAGLLPVGSLNHIRARMGIPDSAFSGNALMRRMGIDALYRRPRTTKPEPGHKIYPYLLRGKEITRPNQVWAMDIRFIPVARGFVYLAVVLVWFSRRVLSWRVSITMEAAFCVETLQDA